MDENNKFPLVSIGMPVYNGECYIREALNSLLTQTITDIELIISDNASTDNTEAICLEYAQKDTRIRYVRWPNNRGANENFKFVLTEALGEYFMWASHDDIWGQEFVEKCICLLDNYNDAVAAITRSVYDNIEIASGDSPLDSPYVFIRVAKLLTGPGPNSRFYSLYKMKFLHQIHFEEYDFHAGDWAFIFDMAQLGRFLRDDNYIGFVKRPGGEGSNSTNKTEKLLIKSKSIFPLLNLIRHIFKRKLFYGLLLLPLLIRLNYKNYKYMNHE